MKGSLMRVSFNCKYQITTILSHINDTKYRMCSSLCDPDYNDRSIWSQKCQKGDQR